VLAADADGAPSQGQKYHVRRHGRVPDERRLLARIEETQPDIVIRSVGGEHEGHFGVRELTCDGEQRGLILSVRVEDNDRGIARETGCGEGVYLKNAQGSLPGRSLEFCTHPSGRLHFNDLGVA
jgi:hypothetical protein